MKKHIIRWMASLLALFLLGGGGAAAEATAVPAGTAVSPNRLSRPNHGQRLPGLDDVWAQAAAAAEVAVGQTYYVSPQGSNTNSGTSPAAAWRTIARPNGFNFEPGDTLLFAGDETFNGNLVFDQSDCGDALNPVTVGSYGIGQATIDAGSGIGIYVENCGGFAVDNLRVVGDGRFSNDGYGILFNLTPAIATRLSRIWISNNEVAGFRRGGITLSAYNASASAGYEGVQITDNVVHDNGDHGISTVPPLLLNAPGSYRFFDVYVGGNEVYANLGDPASTGSHTGNGIVLGGVDGAVLEHNEAYGNGADDTPIDGGPVGIWAWHCSSVVIQFNESHNNLGVNKDGGGFDIDGGCTDSIMQYNISHSNFGHGYLVTQFENTQWPLSDITIRYNVSINDVRSGEGGAIEVWRSNQAAAAGDIKIYNNSIYLEPTTVSGTEMSAIHTWESSGSMANVDVYNNIFVTTDDLPLVHIPDHVDYSFAGNNYYASGGAFRIVQDYVTYSSIAAWRAAAGQERANGAPVGYSVDPQWVTPGAVDEAGYALTTDSTMIDAGLDLAVLFGVDVGAQDIAGTAVPQEQAYDIGAFEFTQTPPPPPPPPPPPDLDEFIYLPIVVLP